MKIDAQMTDDAVLAELGARLARTRLERNLTQRDLGTEAGVGLATVQRIEAGQPTKLPGVIRVLRALGLLDALDGMVPEPVPSPLERLKLEGGRRRRAARARTGVQSGEEDRGWTWGDEPSGDAS